MNFDSYIPSTDAENNEFRKVAETYFNNYIVNWCNRNNVDDASRERMIRVLSDYSVFFFDSLMHDMADAEPLDNDLKN
jgi:hypothetical protein